MSKEYEGSMDDRINRLEDAISNDSGGSEAGIDFTSKSTGGDLYVFGTDIVFGTGWDNSSEPAYAYLRDDRVYLNGTLRAAAGDGQLLFNLPVELAPTIDKSFPVVLQFAPDFNDVVGTLGVYVFQGAVYLNSPGTFLTHDTLVWIDVSWSVASLP